MIFNARLHLTRAAMARITMAIGAAALLAMPHFSAAQTGPAPLIEELSRQTQALHDSVSASIVRVHLPERLPPEAGAVEELLHKWEQRLEPSVRQKLIEQTAQLRAMRSAMIDDDPFTVVRQGPNHLGGALLIVRPFDPANLAEQMPLRMLNVPQPCVLPPGTLGVVMDDHGLVLVPAYIDRETAAQHTIPVSLPAGGLGQAVYVGSDRPTGVTLVRLTIPSGAPMQPGEARPADGSLVMLFSTQNDGARLAVWTGVPREAGMVVTPDGHVAGFVNAGQFLSTRAARPIVRQLQAFGTVRRAVLGIRVSEIRRDDPLRQQAGLDDSPAMRVDNVQAGSPAERSGLLAGDLILSIAGEPVGDVPSFAAALATRSGQTEVRILRGGQPATLNVLLTRN